MEREALVDLDVISLRFSTIIHRRYFVAIKLNECGDSTRVERTAVEPVKPYLSKATELDVFLSFSPHHSSLETSGRMEGRTQTSETSERSFTQAGFSLPHTRCCKRCSEANSMERAKASLVYRTTPYTIPMF